ncbi:MAG: FKBP-type peptidyl-prolyl cis-trans isomerase [Gemmataceae bacterium]
MLKILIPALAGAAVLGLIVFFVIVPPENETVTTEKGADGKTRVVVTPESQKAKDFSTNTLSQTMPSLDDPAFKDLGKGLRMMDVVEGQGDICPDGATITAHYAGWLATDGTRFDSSYLSAKPALTSSLGGLIQGWQIGIPGMKPGGVRRLIVPAEFGYGKKAMGSIPANSTLVFEFKLLEWKK